MTTWTSEELNEIGSTEEIEIAPMRGDGSLRKPVIIWIVRVGNDLYIRSVKGRASHWFRGSQVQHAGRMWAGGLQKDVTFEEVVDPGLNNQVDEAYRSKYRRYPQYVAPMLVAESKDATLKLVPR